MPSFGEIRREAGAIGGQHRGAGRAATASAALPAAASALPSAHAGCPAAWKSALTPLSAASRACSSAAVTSPAASLAEDSAQRAHRSMGGLPARRASSRPSSAAAIASAQRPSSIRTPARSTVSCSRTFSRPVSSASALPRSRSARAASSRPRTRRARASIQNAGRRVTSWAGLRRSRAAAASSTGPAPSPRGDACDRAARERRRLEHRVADRARVGRGVGGLAGRVVEVAGHERGERQREPQPDAVGRRLGRQLAERDLQPAAGVGRAAQPPLGVRDRDGEPEPLLRRGGAQRLEERVARAGRVARGGLRVREPQLERRPPRARGHEPQRRRPVVRGGRGRGRVQLVRGRDQQRERLLVSRRGRLLDVVRPLDGPGPAPLERARRSGVRAEPPAARRRLVDRVADDRVAEREAPRRPARADQRPGQELVERRQGVTELGHRRRQIELERVAGHRRRLQEPPRVRAQPAELRRHGRGDRRPLPPARTSCSR